jgi:hypothetical protein
VSRWSRRIWKLEKEDTFGTHAFRLPDGRVQQIRTKNLLDADAYEQQIPPLRSASVGMRKQIGLQPGDKARPQNGRGPQSAALFV